MRSVLPKEGVRNVTIVQHAAVHDDIEDQLAVEADNESDG